MSGVGYDPLEEGDAFDAASIDDRFTAVVDFINDLPAWAIAEKGISFEHISGSPLTVTGSSVVGTVDQAGLARVTYTNEWPGTDDDTYADPPGAAGSIEWNLLKRTAGGAAEAKREWTAIGLGDAGGDNVAGILVLVNVERDALARDGTSEVGEEYATVIALQYKDGAGVWRTLPWTERHLSEVQIRLSLDPDPLTEVYANHPDFRDMALRTLITPSHLSAKGGPGSTIAGVRVVVATNGDLGDDAPAFVADNVESRIMQFNLTVIPIRGSDPD